MPILLLDVYFPTRHLGALISLSHHIRPLTLQLILRYVMKNLPADSYHIVYSEGDQLAMLSICHDNLYYHFNFWLRALLAG